MLVCYRDDGFWTQLWYLWSSRLIGGRVANLPGPGFVGQASTSFLATDQRRARLVSGRMHRTAYTDGVRLWRLTCVWELSRRPSLGTPYGTGLAPSGRSWVGDGADDSA